MALRGRVGGAGGRRECSMKGLTAPSNCAVAAAAASGDGVSGELLSPQAMAPRSANAAAGVRGDMRAGPAGFRDDDSAPLLWRRRPLASPLGCGSSAAGSSAEPTGLLW